MAITSPFAIKPCPDKSAAADPRRIVVGRRQLQLLISTAAHGSVSGAYLYNCMRISDLLFDALNHNETNEKRDLNTCASTLKRIEPRAEFQKLVIALKQQGDIIFIVFFNSLLSPS